nr:unnamed protein product [Digitaria exilis]
MAAVAMQQHQRHTERWGDLLDDDDGELDLGVLLPPPVVVGPDAKGIKKVRRSRSAIERRTWAKFGDAAKEAAGSRLTMVSTEEILLDRTGATEPVGRRVTTGPQSPQQVEEGTPSADGSATPDGASGKSEAYIPLFKRLGADKSGADVMRRRNDENSIRVGNLSEDARDHDLADLFGQFGPLSRVYVAMDRVTGESRGFGFVNFVYREDGERAIKKLNGYGYANLILQVDWSGPRPPRPN